MPTSLATNTLIIPNIPHCFFNNDHALETIRSQWETFGELHKLIPMKGFGRLMVIYMETQCALAAKTHMDKATLYWMAHHDDTQNIHILGLTTRTGNGHDSKLVDTTSSATNNNNNNNNNGLLHEMEVRVYFGQHNPIQPDLASLSLQVPDLGRTLLISPPCDPSHSWQQRIESPPSKSILASDLLRALTTVSDDHDMDINDHLTLDGPLSIHTSYESTAADTSSTASSPTLETPTLQISFQHESLPTIMIQDMDGSLLLQHRQKTNRQKPSATPRPPILT